MYDVISSTHLSNTVLMLAGRERSWDVVDELFTTLSSVMSSDESNPSLSDEELIWLEESESGDDYGVVHLGTNAPYRDKPLAIPGQAAQAYHYAEDIDNIPLATSEVRFERQINVDGW